MKNYKWTWLFQILADCVFFLFFWPPKFCIWNFYLRLRKLILLLIPRFSRQKMKIFCKKLGRYSSWKNAIFRCFFQIFKHGGIFYFLNDGSKNLSEDRECKSVFPQKIIWKTDQHEFQKSIIYQGKNAFFSIFSIFNEFWSVSVKVGGFGEKFVKSSQSLLKCYSTHFASNYIFFQKKYEKMRERYGVNFDHFWKQNKKRQNIGFSNPSI